MEKVEIDKSEIIQHFPKRQANSYKGDYGNVVLIGGNQSMGGAIQMAAMACVNSGAGLTTVFTDPVNRPAIHSVIPEVMVSDWRRQDSLKKAIEKADVIGIGPGFGRDHSRFNQIMLLIKQVIAEKILVIDADAISILSQKDQGLDQLSQAKYLVLTPHYGEWDRLSHGEISYHDNEGIQSFVNQYQLNLVLKGAPSRLYFADHSNFYQLAIGNPGMAIGGMGDTLTGMVCGFMGQYTDHEAALKAAAFLHSYIADRIYQDQYIVRPSQIADLLPRVMKEMEAERE
ncbi:MULTISPECIES: NAD(P)H-hydrate dehydratase [Aerococcus]|uniref:NAD(P)H-hydrate dehydratase n=1 Tax=Aerococcus urinae (strain CCUG 59500 / ACS-120-V-Col10a) TaxID=2976812 RepID=UPI000200E742|nr:NAD(P)H-hydrate dehydratase [Aerococcus sp. Group 1]AEA01189.1 YjeF domain protein [Aerococcus sp. Group 1]MCY3030459.1 NAD(P)H-hydrate dehydratase [Aerococcus sp. Group 1]MCY3054501.1 NAD(P)H-hydrate dehydratase [Aerococcus sp. Group 1]MCY3056231.1 NAD(P)H-hydrate dehydratase [Aerococcus sp. Group 1]MCY3061689.1 NAD(P)H-hydrate dehydratase [Aerococcus sp. Group 1]